MVGTHDAAEVPVRAEVRPRLWRGPAGRHEREARTLGPRLARGRTPRSADRAPTLVARQAPRPDPGLGPGQRLPPAERTRFEPALGVDLSGVRVHDGPAARKAAAARKAHAFTFGNHVVLGRAAQQGGPVARAVVLAHELVHVRQQAMPALTGAGSARGPPAVLAGHISCAPLGVQCWAAGDLVPGFVSDAAGAVAGAGGAALRAVGEVGEGAFDWVLDGVRSRARDLPGYSMVAQVIGRDPITGEAVTVERNALVETLLTYGPFGPAVAAVLEAAEVIGHVFDALTAGLEANRLTRRRVVADIAAAFDEFTLSAGIAANLAIVRRYLDAFCTDLRNVVRQMAGRVIAIVRAVVVDLAEPFLAIEAIKPVWDLTKQVLHRDPLRGVEVEAPTVEILANFLRLIGQGAVVEQMRERGTLQATADWLDTQVGTFRGLLGQLGALFAAAWAAIQPANLPNLLSTLPTLAAQAFGLVQGVASFAFTVIAKVLELVKSSLLGWLSEHAHQVPGFHLITVIIEQNPFTGDVVPRTAENLIKGFITLLPGGAATYQSLAESGVIADAATRIENEMSALGITPSLIISTFLGVWDNVTLQSLLTPQETFRRIVDLFGDPISRIFRFIRVVIEVVITLVLRLMNFPSDLLSSIISHTVAAIEDIKRDPVAFLINLLEALKAGFLGFFDRIGNYLLEGLTAWLFRGLGQIGVTVPTQWTLASALDLVLQVLGLSSEFLWRKLGEHIGEERVAQVREAIGMLTGAWTFIRGVQERGLAAIWDYVVSRLSGLWDTVLSQAREWIMTRVVTAVTARLISMLDPTGVMAVVNSVVAFFDAVQSAIEYFREILEIVNMYVMTLAAVAAGNITPGAQRIERALAAAIPVAIGFLANQVGLGNIPERIVEIIQSLRQMVEQAVDWLITQALRLGRAALDALGAGRGEDADDEGSAEEKQARLDAGMAEAVDAANRVGSEPVAAGVLQPTLDQIRRRHRLRTLELTAAGERWAVRGSINPDAQETTDALKPGAGPVGNVAPHKDQPSPRPGLWSEHVIPRSMISSVLSVAGLPAVTNTEYNEMHTVLIYREARANKDFGPNRDLSLVARIRGRVGRTPEADVVRFGDSSAIALRAFRTLAHGAVNRTVQAVRADHASDVGAARGDPQMLPSESVIRQTAATQQDEIEQIFSGRGL
ncbi:eCIS core domain-containing protein [Pseudactinotalea sp. Z1739]|uniref:eCIS core domain-containing protein n=1 Tax=Pseudactinotalea sp. Z1739 TaxID=3413028 RepID=UPI003C7D27BB